MMVHHTRPSAFPQPSIPGTTIRPFEMAQNAQEHGGCLRSHARMGKDGRVLHDVVSAVYRGAYLIELEFDDGQRGTVDFARYLERRGVFERFRDLEFFGAIPSTRSLGS